MLSNSIMEHWMISLVKMFGIWLGPDLQIEKNWNEVVSKVALITQTLSE